MGLLALFFSVVVDALWPLRGRPRNVGSAEAQSHAAEADAADPLAEAPYDPLVDDEPGLTPASSTDAHPGSSIGGIPEGGVDSAVDPVAGAPVGSATPASTGAAASGADSRGPGAFTGGAVGGGTAGAGAGASSSPLPTGLADTPPHPLQRYALRLASLVSSDVTAVPGHPVQRHLNLPGWLGVVAVPVVLLAIVEALLGEFGGFLVFLLHVGVLYLTVGLGAFHRQFTELQLLLGAGEERSARIVLARWIGSASRSHAGLGAAANGVGGPSARATGVSAAGSAGVAANAAAASTAGASDYLPRSLAGLATAQSVLAAYRDVFAPLFWYAVLPGAIGPVLYLFARFAACHSYPFARTAYYWLDWIPLRLASLGFALAGQFEDTVFCLRAVSPIRTASDPSTDPFLHQRLLLLPVAGGALGLRLTDAGVDAQLRQQAPDLDLPGVEPEAESLRPVSGLLLRSSFVWLGLYLLVKLLD